MLNAFFMERLLPEDPIWRQRWAAPAERGFTVTHSYSSDCFHFAQLPARSPLPSLLVVFTCTLLNWVTVTILQEHNLDLGQELVLNVVVRLPSKCQKDLHRPLCHHLVSGGGASVESGTFLYELGSWSRCGKRFDWISKVIFHVMLTAEP